MAAQRAKLAKQNATDFETVPDFVDRRKSCVPGQGLHEGSMSHAPPNPRALAPPSTEYPCDQALTLSAPHAPPRARRMPLPVACTGTCPPSTTTTTPSLSPRRRPSSPSTRCRTVRWRSSSTSRPPHRQSHPTRCPARKDARRRRVRDTATARVVAFSRSQCSEDPARARALYVTLAARAVKVHPGRRHSCGVSCGFHRPPVSPNSPCPTRFTPAPLTYAVCCRRPRVLVPASSPRVLAPTSSCSALAASLAPTSSCRSPPEETPLRCAVEIRV